ncbi:hypothetical protein FRACYDRAFT_238440 [Fragilariopsis cylindrus CCMP1102]|uniref:Uncharacterized protein n=1 Tax=Fragilariopsis cylindrus CCMP1102 TaxID=635003 RepID=A0A1E7FIK6_9STRA|nr:hypothetical protein FRACYDRAFT_238440 [Fragilariopsis cylindrus CCMP1102]|eukprot:OEU18009.1 hypothetical protein FRACYDRAFT_238440 [Fragilariopsis cylindrus CCMP1102]
MIAALAYVYNLNNNENSNNDNDNDDNDNKVEYVYGGACGGSGGPNTKLLFSQHRKLIHAIGLDEVFKITNRYPQGIVKQKDIRIIIRKIESKDYEQQDKDQQDQGEVDENYDTTTNNNNKYKVVVHIRRGDVTPCMTGPPTRSDKIKISRYTPNLLFLNVLQQIIDNKTYGMNLQPNEVTIFSTSSTIQQYENFTIFEKLGYNIEINGPIENVWKRISSPETKIVILSKSSFSYVPALLASGDNATTTTTNTKIIYTPFWMEAPTTTTTTTNRSSESFWDVVDQQILNDAEVKMKELRSKFCGSAKKNQISWSNDDDKVYDDDNYAP